MAMSTGLKIGIGVGAAALAVILIAALSSKPAAAATKPPSQPPPGGPPAVNPNPVPVDQNGGVQLAPGNMGTLTISRSAAGKPGVDVYVPNTATDKLVSMTSSNPSVLPIDSNAPGAATSSVNALSNGTTTVTYFWTSGSTQNQTTFTVVVQQ